MIGRVVGNYEIVERVGEGGMGTVWRTIDVMLEREVAIKAIRPELAREPQIIERFRSEARTIARVSHPAIAIIYSFFRDGEEWFIAMELVRGRSLAQVLREEGALPWRRAVPLLDAALEGIEQVHRLGIVHRDLKPDNLMLAESGAIKVMDFGIARVAGSGHLTRWAARSRPSRRARVASTAACATASSPEPAPASAARTPPPARPRSSSACATSPRRPSASTTGSPRCGRMVPSTRPGETCGSAAASSSPSALRAVPAHTGSGSRSPSNSPQTKS